MKKLVTKCPFCKRRFPKKNVLCLCGAYRVTDENYDKSFKEIYGAEKNEKRITANCMQDFYVNKIKKIFEEE